MNKTSYTLAIAAVIVAAALVAGSFATVAFADGDTKITQKNKAKAIASGFGTTAANIQANLCCVF